MNYQAWLIICSQVLPGVFLSFIIVTVILSYTVPSWYFVPGVGWEYTTLYSINPEQVIGEFLNGLMFVLFFSLVGVLFSILFGLFEQEREWVKTEPEAEQE